MDFKKYLVLSVLLGAVLFVAYRSQFLVYFSLLYALLLYLERESIKPLHRRGTLRLAFGVALILISPVFLAFKIGTYPSPVSFYFLFMWGLLELSFEAPLLIRTVPPAMVAIAMAMRTDFLKRVLSKTSELFVGVTSKLVEVMIKISGVPIEIRGNVATVGSGIVIIGSGCSGLDAFILYILASLLLIYLRKSERKEALLLLAGALGIIPLNAVRIFALLFIGQRWGIPFLELFHSHLGDLMFVAYVFLYWKWALGRSKNKRKGPNGSSSEVP